MALPGILTADSGSGSGSEADDERSTAPALHATANHRRGPPPALTTIPLNVETTSTLGTRRSSGAPCLSQDCSPGSALVDANDDDGDELREQQARHQHHHHHHHHHGSADPLASTQRCLRRQRSLRSGLDGTSWDAQQPAAGETRRALPRFLQRVAETGVMVAVGMAVVFGNKDVVEAIHPWRRELSTFFTVIAILYLTFPLRISAGVFSQLQWRPIVFFPFIFHFDAAPLIYPVFIPVLVALVLAPASPFYILPNIILSLSSLPPSIVPFNHAPVTTFDPLHWLVTILPYLPSEYLSLHNAGYLPLNLRGFDPELLFFLYPLHRSLSSLLYGLVTTSLLPSELSLLATGMINLYLFAQSPQMQIFKGASLFCLFLFLVLCQDALHVVASLAQIPTWKFRRRVSRKSIAGTGTSTSTTYRGFFRQLDQRVCAFLIGTPRRSSESEHEAMESDLYTPVRAHQQQQIRSPYTDRETPTSPLTGEATCSSPIKPLLNGRKRRVLPPELAEFASLTSAQAQVRKYVCSTYVYVMGLLIGMVPCRLYIRDMALNGRDPFAWAYGYLFEDVFAFGQWKEWLRASAELGSRFRTPGSSFFSDPGGWVEHVRRDIVGEANTRLILSGYFVSVIACSLLLVFRARGIDTDTRRKVFHGMMVSMLLPTLFIDPLFLALAFIVILNTLLVLDVCRAACLPPIARPIAAFLAPYVDTRDSRGPVVVSHMYLLIGCAIPLWLSLASTPRAGAVFGTGGPPSRWPGWDVHLRDLSMVSGVVCVGMGDAAASLVGRRWGRHKWFFSRKKSVEGSLAFALAVFAGLVGARAWLVLGGWAVPSSSSLSWSSSPADYAGTGVAAVLCKAFVAAAGSSLMEALLTGGNDNVVIPLILWLLVKGLRI